MTSRKPRGSEVTVALIGLVGVLVTGFFSNMDKIFPDRNRIEERVVGDYLPTGEWETELRYFFEVSGMRAYFVTLVNETIAQAKQQEIERNPERAERILEAANAAEEEMLLFDQLVEAYMPVYRKYLTIEELQTLNRFFSTKPMRQFVAKQSEITRDSVPISLDLQRGFLERMNARLD